MPDDRRRHAGSLPRLLGKGDAPAFRIVDGSPEAGILLVCDHASARVPQALADLGLPDAVFRQHVAIDIGSEAVTLDLARRLNAPAIIAGYSRLVIDCNRDPADPESVLAESDGHRVPGNAGLDPEARAIRVADLFDPYHRAIEAALARLKRSGPLPVLFSVHTFTPSYQGEARPWHVGILWNRDGRLAQAMLAALRARGDCVVGDNEPYSGRTKAYTLNRHAGETGLAHCAVEIRQDLVSDDAGAGHWAAALAEALDQALGHPDLRVARRY